MDYRKFLRKKKTFENEKDIENVGSVYDIISAQYKDSMVCVVGITEKKYSIMWEGLPRVDLSLIDTIKKKVEDIIIDLRILGVGYAPIERTTSDVWKPLCIEIILLKDGVSAADCMSNHSDKTTIPQYDTIGLFDTSIIEDKPVRRIAGQFINCMQYGDRPEKYKNTLKGITYLLDKESGIHYLMLESVPSLNLSLLSKISYLFSGSLENIVFERRMSKKAGKWSDTDSATTMIVGIAGNPKYHKNRDGFLTYRKKPKHFSPY